MFWDLLRGAVHKWRFHCHTVATHDPEINRILPHHAELKIAFHPSVDIVYISSQSRILVFYEIQGILSLSGNFGLQKHDREIHNL